MSHPSETLMWYYLDSTGQEFGPFPSETMHEWFSMDYFPIRMDLRVRLGHWTQHYALKELYKSDRPFVGPPIGGMNGPPSKQGGGEQGRSRTFSGGKGGGGGGGGRGGGRGGRGAGQLPMPYSGGLPGDAPYPAVMDPMAAAGLPPQGYGMPMGPMGGGPAMAGFPMVGADMAQPMQQSRGRGGSGSGMAMPFPTGRRFQGHIKSFNAKQGFGFIDSQEAHAIFGRDVFLHKAQVGDMTVGTEVIFACEPNRQGMPQARDITLLDGSSPGPAPADLGQPPVKGPMSGGGGCGGGGRGNGRGGKGGGKGRRGPKGGEKGGGGGCEGCGGGFAVPGDAFQGGMPLMAGASMPQSGFVGGPAV